MKQGWQRGIENYNGKLDAVDVLTIKQLHAYGYSYGRLAQIFSVSKTQIWRIIKGYQRNS